MAGFEKNGQPVMYNFTFEEIIELQAFDMPDARSKSRKLKEAVAAGRLYEDADLTLATLAVKPTMHPHDLSRIINLGMKKNFNDFINEFRVREVVRKMQDSSYDHLTLLGIAFESGFNSQRTFNRVFKEMTGKTPVEYKNNLKKKWPFDKLATLPHRRPVILRSGSPPNRLPEKLKRNHMFRNYFKTAFRNLRQQKLSHKIVHHFGMMTVIPKNWILMQRLIASGTQSVR